MNARFDGGPLDGHESPLSCDTPPAGILVGVDGSDPACRACGGVGQGEWVNPKTGDVDDERFECERCGKTGVEPNTPTLTYMLQMGCWPGPFVYRVVDLPMASA